MNANEPAPSSRTLFHSYIPRTPLFFFPRRARARRRSLATRGRPTATRESTPPARTAATRTRGVRTRTRRCPRARKPFQLFLGTLALQENQHAGEGSSSAPLNQRIRSKGYNSSAFGTQHPVSCTERIGRRVHASPHEKSELWITCRDGVGEQPWTEWPVQFNAKDTCTGPDLARRLWRCRAIHIRQQSPSRAQNRQIKMNTRLDSRRLPRIYSLD